MSINFNSKIPSLDPAQTLKAKRLDGTNVQVQKILTKKPPMAVLGRANMTLNFCLGPVYFFFPRKDGRPTVSVQRAEDQKSEVFTTSKRNSNKMPEQFFFMSWDEHFNISAHSKSNF